MCNRPITPPAVFPITNPGVFVTVGLCLLTLLVMAQISGSCLGRMPNPRKALDVILMIIIGIVNRIRYVFMALAIMFVWYPSWAWGYR